LCERERESEREREREKEGEGEREIEREIAAPRASRNLYFCRTFEYPGVMNPEVP
jgi:hypothetical protein